MAHFARIENGIVRDVIVIDNNNCGGGDFPESEAIGKAFINNIGLTGEYIQTSYNGNFRGIYAGIGYSYNADLDKFIAPYIEEVEEI